MSEKNCSNQSETDVGYSIGNRFEVKVNIEAMSRCPGSCMGCLMTAEERKNGRFWDPSMFDLTKRFMARYIDFHRPSLEKADTFEVAVNLGQGDHMEVKAEAIAPAMNFIASVFEKRSVAFITAAAVSEKRRLEASAARWKSAADGQVQSFYADVVFDPMMYKREGFGQRYRENIALLRRYFTEVDPNINIGPDTIQAITPQELHDFVCDNAFRILTLNFVPTLANAAQMKASLPNILDWIIELMGIWMPVGSTERPLYFFNTFSTIGLNLLTKRRNEAQGVAVDDDWLIETMADNLARLIYIDHEGNVSFTQAGIGDYPIGGRTGGRSIGNVRNLADDENLPQRIAAGARGLAARIVVQMDSRETCADCRHRTVCAMTGGAQLERLLGGEEGEGGGCPTGIIRIYDAVDRYDDHQIRLAASGIRPAVGVGRLTMDGAG